MEPSFIVIGRLTRDYLLPPVGQPLLDSPGGDVLHAAGGLAVWDRRIGLVARAGEDYPRAWLSDFETRGFDVRGIRIQPGSLDLRSFLAYSDEFEPIANNPVTHFARHGVPFPKELLGYQPRETNATSPVLSDIPADYLDAGALHLCPLDPVILLQFADALRGALHTLTLDPPPALMKPDMQREARAAVNGLTACLPSLEELNALFWGQTHDPWEMAAALGEWGCEYVVVKCGERGQKLYDAGSKQRWEIPAYPARLADPTGAGEAFCGGFLAGYRRGFDPLEGVLCGNVSASLAIEGSGPFYPLDVMPGLAEARFNALREMVRKI